MEVASLRAEGIHDVYLHAAYAGDYSGFISELGQAPLGMGYNSSNGFMPRYDTREMTDFLRLSKEVFETFPYLDISVLPYEEQIASKYSENALLWPFDLMLYELEVRDGFAHPEALMQWRILPEPGDIFGNRYNGMGHLSVYSKAGNPDEAIVFLAEFLSEEYQRQYATAMMFGDMSRYSRMRNFPAGLEALAADMARGQAGHAWLGRDAYELYYDLIAKYANGEISAEQFSSEMQRGMEQRLMG